MVLVKIVPAMREDYIRREDFLEFFEALFDRRTEVGKESISKGFHHDSLLARTPKERVRAALCFRGACRIGTQHEPVEFDALRLLNHPQHRPAAADLVCRLLLEKKKKKIYKTKMPITNQKNLGNH